MTPQKNKPISNTQRALNELRKMIFSGALPAGSDHLESELADLLGMSRTPVREAALTLESQGLVEMRPRKGVRILTLSPDDMREIYEVLTELESLAARRAAERGLSKSKLAKLAAAIDDMDKALSIENLEDWAKADDRFHQELVKLGNNQRVLAISEIMNDQVRRARMVTLYMRPVPKQSNDDHRQVYKAILSGNQDLAAETHRVHRQITQQILLNLLEKHRLFRV